MNNSNRSRNFQEANLLKEYIKIIVKKGETEITEIIWHL